MKKKTKAGKSGKVVKVAKSAKTGAKGTDLEAVFDELEGMMAVHVPLFKVTNGMVRNKRDYHLTVPMPVVISPKHYGGKPYPVSMASLILQKGYVGFYYLPMDPEAMKKIKPELGKLKKGGCCFHVKGLTPEVRAGVKQALEMGEKSFRERGWV
ncbi:MAG TPA: hypothetical protein VGH37_16850 [Candidatus Acidoferrum sp.]|jgi:hypothetical protein